MERIGNLKEALADKTVLVTGAGRGLGHGVARAWRPTARPSWPWPDGIRTGRAGGNRAVGRGSD